MDRVIVYDAALPQTQDILSACKFGMVGQSFQNQAMLGSTTVVAGLACTPTVPASLQVNIGTGSIYQVDPTDSTAYGDLGTDGLSIVKQGINKAVATFTITPPGTVGFSQVYLIEAALQDVDGGLTVLSYYNSADPTRPFSGPANSGTSQFTTRTGIVALVLKPGVAATTGTQTTPTPDVGYVSLFAITVANGQLTITGGNIAQVPSAPYFPTLPQVPGQVQVGTYVYAGQDTGAANAYVITFAAGQPIPTAYTAGMGVKFKALNANSGASTINVNGLGTVAIRRASGIAIATGDISSGQVVELTYDGTLFQMQNYIGSGSITNTSTLVNIPYVTDTGAANAIVATFSPAITSGQQVAGLTIEVKLANPITGPCTINVNGIGTKPVTMGNLGTPITNAFPAGMVVLLIYDGTEYQISNARVGKCVINTTSNSYENSGNLSGLGGYPIPNSNGIIANQSEVEILRVSGIATSTGLNRKIYYNMSGGVGSGTILGELAEWRLEKSTNGGASWSVMLSCSIGLTNVVNSSEFTYQSTGGVIFDNVDTANTYRITGIAMGDASLDTNHVRLTVEEIG